MAEGGLEATLAPLGERQTGAAELVERWRRHVGQVPGLESLAFSTSHRPGANNPPIDIVVSHRDSEKLEAVAKALASALGEYEGVTDVDDGVLLGKPQLDFTLSPAGIAEGFTTANLSGQVRAAFYGAEALRQQRGRYEQKVMVRLPRSERRSLATVEDLIVRTPAGGEMPLRAAARVEEGRAYSRIMREDGRRSLRVQARVDEELANAREVSDDVFAKVLPGLKERYPGLQVGVAGRQQDNADFFAYLGTAYLMALLAVFVLIALPLGSYGQTLFVVMAAIPFGVQGAVVAHWAMGITFSMMSLMGIVALSGVIVNDSLVLIDAANHLRAEGLSPLDAARGAAEGRFRAVVLTSLTTFFGLAPMIFETSVQAQMLIPMAVSLGFGILFSTVVVLTVVPSLYLSVETLREARLARQARLDESPVTA